jgi:HAE1 family hydrophobic/amphiphilic exporter-1
MVNALQGVSGVDTVQSTSSQGSSLVAVIFKDGVDLKTAQQDINTAVSRARPLLPAQTPASTVQTFSTNSLPILEYAVSADDSPGDLAGLLRAQALPKLKGLAGVSSVVITGAPTDEVDVTLDPAKLAPHGLSAAQVSAALQQATNRRTEGSPEACLKDDDNREGASAQGERRISQAAQLRLKAAVRRSANGALNASASSRLREVAATSFATRSGERGCIRVVGAWRLCPGGHGNRRFIDAI